jgi:hypothetical protein
LFGWSHGQARKPHVECGAGGFTIALRPNLAIMLFDESLVLAEQTSNQTMRYHFLETFWHYGEERLADSGESSDTFAAHAEYFVEFASAGDAGIASAAQNDWSGWLEAELDNFRGHLQSDHRKRPRRELPAGPRCLAGPLPRAWRAAH